MVWACSPGEPRLAAAAPFYGPAPSGADFTGTAKAAVLGVYAELDSRVNAARDAATRPWRRRSDSRDRDVARGRPRLLQRHRPALQRDCGGGSVEKVLGWFGTHLG